MDVNVPKMWEPYLQEALNKPDIKKNLELSNQSLTYSGLGVWVIRNFLVENTSFKLQHLNTKENHITIIDNRLRRTVEVYPREPNELWCDFCKNLFCEHTTFALTIPEVRKTLAQKGWKLDV